jgi:hypothetical protein
VSLLYPLRLPVPICEIELLSDEVSERTVELIDGRL